MGAHGVATRDSGTASVCREFWGHPGGLNRPWGSLYWGPRVHCGNSEVATGDLGKLMVLHWRRRSHHQGCWGHKVEQGELEGRYRELGTTKDSGDATRNAGVTAWKSGG